MAETERKQDLNNQNLNIDEKPAERKPGAAGKAAEQEAGAAGKAAEQEAGAAEKAAEQEAGAAAKPAGRTAGKGAAAAAGKRSAADGARTAKRRTGQGAKAPGQKTGNAAKTADRRKKDSAKGRKKKATTQTIVKSFGHAFDGIMSGFEERNMKIHCTMAVLVVFFGLVLHISVTEWCICLVLFGLIMGLELVNTAIEAVVDMVTKDYHPLAKRAKDAAAGAVLIASIMAAAAGLIIFIPRLLYVLRSL